MISDLMISDLMTWEEHWVEDNLGLSLRDVILKVPMGRFSVGATFVDGFVDFEEGTLTLGTDDDEYVFKLEISIGREVRGGRAPALAWQDDLGSGED